MIGYKASWNGKQKLLWDDKFSVNNALIITGILIEGMIIWKFSEKS